MTSVVHAPARPNEAIGDAPPPAPRRPRVQMIGTALASAASAMALLGMVGVYLSVRASVISGGDAWFTTAEIALAPANMSLFTLAMAAMTMQWAVYSAARSDRPHAYLAVGVTLLLGVSHLLMMAFYYSEIGLTLNETASTQAVLVYSITGFSLAMIVAGMIYILLMTTRALGGQFTGGDSEGIAAAAMYWYVAIAGYAVVWYAIFITK